MPRSILLFGSSGQLGIELTRLLSPIYELNALARFDVDLADSSAIREAIRVRRPTVILNAAAYTAVDRAESEPDLAHTVNAIAPQVMAEEALRLNAWFVHFSTDYVFDGSGSTPWKEADLPNPLNVYGRTKLEGERLIAATGCRYLIFRTSWVYAAHGNNFLRTMLRLGAQRPELRIVNDQVGAPTSTGEIARGIARVLDRLVNSGSFPPESGVYHMTCGGACSWFEFASAIFASTLSSGPAPALHPIPSDQYPTPARRPLNSRLDCSRFADMFESRLAPWQEALNRVIVELSSEGARSS